MNVVNLPPGKSSKQNQQRIMKFQVRVRGILQGILDQLNPKNFPPPLTKFLASFTEEGSFMPNDFLTDYEISRLELDSYGSLTHMNLQREQMLLGFFLLSKVLVGRVLLQPEKHSGLMVKFQETAKRNLKMIATCI